MPHHSASESEDESNTTADSDSSVPVEPGMWKAIEILAERGNRYKVNWVGDDPATGNPWPPSWVNKEDCTHALVEGWERKKAAKKRKRRPDSKTVRARPASTRRSKRLTATRSISVASAENGGRSLTKVATSTSGVSRLLDSSHGSPTGSIDDGPPRKKTKIIVEVVIPVRKRDGISHSQASSVHRESVAPDSPQHGPSDIEGGESPQHESMVPETQLHDESIISRPTTPERPNQDPPRVLRSGSSVISRMKRRTGGSANDRASSDAMLPALSLEGSQQSTGGPPPTIFEDYPLTTSTQQADFDSQSLEQSVALTQNKELMQELQEARARLQELEQTLSAKSVENIQLQTENEDLSAALGAANSTVEECRRLNNLLEDEIEVLKQAHVSAQLEWEKRVQEQDATISGLRVAKQEADLDRDLFKDNYGHASSFASEMQGKKEELEAELTIVKGQLSSGLPMLKGMYEERIKRLEEEVEKWRTLCHVLTEKDERTNDDMRRRAAEEPELREEIRRLKLELTELRAAKLTSVPLADESTPELEPDAYYVCQFVDVPRASMCHATFESPKDVEYHALREHYQELLGLI